MSSGHPPGFTRFPGRQRRADYLPEERRLSLPQWPGRGFYDDNYPFINAPYFRQYLKTAYVRDDTEIFDLAGASGGLFDGLAFSIHGSGGADNQVTPDEVRPQTPISPLR